MDQNKPKEIKRKITKQFRQTIFTIKYLDMHATGSRASKRNLDSD
jgi:hypothetical protein